MSITVTLTGLDQLNDSFRGKAYVFGGAPTKSDAELFDALSGVALEGFPHLARWYKHIASFHEAKRSKWAAPSVEIKVAGKFAISAPAKKEEEEDDDFDIFGDDTEDDKAAREEAAAKMKEAAGPQKKSGKSEIMFEVKPWEAETDMQAMEAAVRAITMEGLHWGGSKLVPVAFGVKKLLIAAIVHDDVQVDDLEDSIRELEDYVQSIDIASWNKL
eukprot:TRINITY_DN2416_c0_g1_i1.p1 TRINITY_DN2416_c0_g1~~TRINITY_DN2416_c0_g1_i1.p1  ORF type:complete len:216 (+),score=69.01 TRINITY_DN2416_c0_g1_i1:107-754(+)